MSLLKELKKENTVLNTKGGKYYSTSYNNNLDLFSIISRYSDENKIISTFDSAYVENHDLALANLLYILDIRGGKGERRVFKTIYKHLCINYKDDALKILPYIKDLGRFDYMLEGIGTDVESETIMLIKKTLDEDLKSDSPSLLAKWLPSHRTHKKNNELAKILMKKLNLNEKEYRKTLSTLRSRINIVEKNLTDKEYDKIDFSLVPSKAMLKYVKAYNTHMKEKFETYKKSVASGDVKINTTGLYAYEIVKKAINDKEKNDDLYNLMWSNQKNFLKENKDNLLVVADTSGSMLAFNGLPLYNSVGLAIYIAERNKGMFHNHFITFSYEPEIVELKGNTLSEKIKSMKQINVLNTDIDKVFELILNTATKNKLKQEDMPSHIIIISDMEFDRGIVSSNGTNFDGWKEAFISKGFKLPQIIFWNVAGNPRGLPVTKFDEDVAMISGFSTSILDNLLSLENLSPEKMMIEVLSKYLDLLK